MKITLSRNIDNIGVAIEANKDEMGGVDGRRAQDD